MPAFKDTPCPGDEDLAGDLPKNADLCVEVLLPNLGKDMLVLSLIHGTSIYEGYLRNEKDVPVILIDVPSTKRRVVRMTIYFYLKKINKLTLNLQEFQMLFKKCYRTLINRSTSIVTTSQAAALLT